MLRQWQQPDDKGDVYENDVGSGRTVGDAAPVAPDPGPVKARETMLELDKRGAVTVVRLAHGKVNALDVELLQAIEEVMGGLDPGQAVVLTGAGRAFSAGVDLKRVADGGMDYVRVFRPALSRAVKAVFDHPGPVVAAINGHAIAGGCVLAAACDLRLMSGGRIGLSEMRVGVPFPAVPLEVMRHVVGTALRRMVLDAVLLGPEEAAEIGLVDHVTSADALLDDAVAEAERLKRIPADVYALTKRQLQGPAQLRIEAISQADEDTVTALWAAPSTLAAISTFLAALKEA
jgi:enoyl-CoA hydratase